MGSSTPRVSPRALRNQLSPVCLPFHHVRRLVVIANQSRGEKAYVYGSQLRDYAGVFDEFPLMGPIKIEPFPKSYSNWAFAFLEFTVRAVTLSFAVDVRIKRILAKRKWSKWERGQKYDAD